MGIQKALAALFTSGAVGLALTFVSPAGPPPLLAQSSGCGGYSGQVCSQTKSCVYYLIYSICTTVYTYYPKEGEGKREGEGGGGPDPIQG